MKIKYLSGALMAAILAISAYYFPKPGNDPKTTQTTTTTAPEVIVATGTASNVVAVVSSTDPLSINDIRTLANPNIGKVDYYPIPNSLGTVILIPQEHQNPGTDPMDPANDLAVKTQKEIYQILGDLTGKLHVTTVMAEGDMFGVVPENKIRYLANLLVLKNQLASHIADLEKEQNQMTAPLLGHLKTYVNSLEREIMLTGAPYDLKAEGSTLVIYGIENKDTFDRSAALVRNYVYLLDRKQQLTSNYSVKPNKPFSRAIALPTNAFDPATALQTEIMFTPSVFLTQNGRSALASASRTLADIEQLKATQNSNVGKLPSRSANPYMGVKNAKEIEALLKKNSEDIQKTIIDQRNIDTATNCLQIITEKNLPSIILQLGAGHEDGIIKELNARALSVIVVSPRSVLKS